MTRGEHAILHYTLREKSAQGKLLPNKNKMSHGIKCPNHHVELTQLGFPIPAKGQGVCPVSGASFDFVADTQGESDTMTIDSKGNKIPAKNWKVIGND